jgi:hypothetical protein
VLHKCILSRVLLHTAPSVSGSHVCGRYGGRQVSCKNFLRTREHSLAHLVSRGSPHARGSVGVSTFTRFPSPARCYPSPSRRSQPALVPPGSRCAGKFCTQYSSLDSWHAGRPVDWCIHQPIHVPEACVHLRSTPARPSMSPARLRNTVVIFKNTAPKSRWNSPDRGVVNDG